MMGAFFDEHRDFSASVVTYDAEADVWEAAPRALWPPTPGLSSPCRCKAVAIDGGIMLFDCHGAFQYRNAAWSLVAEGREVAQVTSTVVGPVLLG